MEDIYARKAEIQEKLAIERKRSDMIKESLTNANDLTNSMVSILNEFDERLHKLEDTILPLHRKTKDLQRLQDNIEKTVVALDHVIGYHHVAHEVDTVLKRAPSGQVEHYIKCMERLVEAIDFFSVNNPDSPELNTVNALYKNGKERLETEFHNQLSRLSKPIGPIRVLKDLDDEALKIDSQDYFSEKTAKDLAQIALWLTGPGKSQNFAKSYSEIRSKAVFTTLENLRDYMKTFTTNPGTRRVPGSLNTPKKGGSKRIRAHEKRKETSGKTYPPIAEEEVIDLEIEPFLKMVSACKKLLLAEYVVLQSIIPDKHKKRVFDDLVAEPLNLLSQVGNKFVVFAKQCITNHDHPSLVNIFPAIKHLKHILPFYNDILKACSDLNRTKLSQLIEDLELIGVKVLDDFTDCVKSDPDKESNMPKDGTVHELTSNAMLFMQQLSQNAETAGGMLAAQRLGSQQPSEVMRKHLAQYVTDVLGALKLNLENKSRVYVDGALASIFLLNNYQFILSALDRHGLLILVEIATPDVESIYRRNIEEQKLIYIRCWNKFQMHMSNEIRGVVIDAQPGAKLKDKEKQIVKEKFKSFNNDFEELIKVQHQWAIPNQEVKSEIRRMVKQKIVPPYKSFRSKYMMIQFTKNIEKYLKHTAEDVEAQIESLFDQSLGH